MEKIQKELIDAMTAFPELSQAVIILHFGDDCQVIATLNSMNAIPGRELNALNIITARLKPDQIKQIATLASVESVSLDVEAKID